MGTVQQPPESQPSPDSERPQGRIAGRHVARTRPYVRIALVAGLVVAAAGIGLVATSGDTKPAATKPTTAASAAGPSGQPTTPEDPGSPGPAASGVPQTGPGTFGYATTPGAVLGTAGTLRRFQAGVETGIGQDATAFAAVLDAVLGDQRGWIAGADVRFQRVSKDTTPEFTIMLATPGTSEKLCAAGGLHTRGYTSCVVGTKVVINLARWLVSTKDYGASLKVYRAYAVNHEIGHVLGLGNESCPGQGKPAPVMVQQTVSLGGCVANAWVYLNGQRYSGTRIP